MLSQLKDPLWQLLYSSGAVRLCNLFTRMSPRILMYHRFGSVDSVDRVGVATFERQIQILRGQFNVVSLSSVYALLSEGRPIPPYTVILTIDDGYEDFYVYAYPILKKYLMPATIYVTSGFIDKNIWLWPDFIKFVLNHTRFKEFSFRDNENEYRYDFKRQEDRLRAWSDIADYCLTLQDRAKNEFLRDLASNLEVVVSPVPEPEYQALSWGQIREMSQNGIEIGSHTCTHPRLVSVESSDLMHEIQGSKSRIESMLDEQVDSFAYPHGAKSDFNSDVKELVRKVGYKTAMAAYFDLDTMEDFYEIKRYGIGNDSKDFINVTYGVRLIAKAMGRA